LIQLVLLLQDLELKLVLDKASVQLVEPFITMEMVQILMAFLLELQLKQLQVVLLH